MCSLCIRPLPVLVWLPLLCCPQTPTTLPLPFRCCWAAVDSAEASSTPTREWWPSSPLPRPLPRSFPLCQSLLSAPFSSPHCTFTATGYRHAYQLWRPCYTCNLIDSNGCCQVCANTCHAGHLLGEERLSNFFCDCGSRGPSFCHSLEDHSGGSATAPSAHGSHHPSTSHGAVSEGHWTARRSSNAGLSGSLLSPDSALDVSGGLFAGSPPVSLDEVVRSVLSTNAQLFQSDSLQSLPATIREAAVQMHAREKLRRSRKREKKQAATQADRPSEKRRRGESFALSAFAACVEEMKEDEESQDTATAASSPILLAVSHFLFKLSPFSMRLPSSQRRQFDLLLRRFCHATFARSPSPASSSASADSALRLWLTVGGVSERLEAALFLVELRAAATPLSPSISSFISAFVNEGRRRQRRILRTSRSSHTSELSSRAVRMSIDLICSSLALTPPVPTLSAASLASATASSHVSSGSVAQTTGVFPSLAASTKGDFLFFLSASYGLVKLGTGQGSVVGELIEQNPWLALHAGGHLVCLRDGASDESSSSEEHADVLLLRSPLLPTHRLLRIDCSTLQVTGSMSMSSLGEEAEPAYLFELEHELVSSTPSTSTTPHWQPLAPILATSTDFSSLSSDAYAVIQQCLASSQWKLGDPFSLSNVVSLVVVAAGIFLVIEQSSQQPPTHYRIRLKAQKRPMPLLPDYRQTQRTGASPSQFITFSDSSPVRVQTFSRRRPAEGKEPEVKCSCEWHVVDELPMDDYRHPLPPPQPLLPTIVASSISAPSTSPSLSSSRPCDGCGLVDWRYEEEFTCLDGCAALSLCSWCHLHQRFNSPSHTSHHHMDHYLPSPPPEHSTYHPPIGLLHAELSGGVLYWDGARIVLFPPRLPSSTLRHWRDFAAGDIVDVKDLYQKW